MSSESEGYLQSIVTKHSSIQAWIETDKLRLKPFMSFISQVLSARGNSLIYKRNRATILLIIMMIEMLLELVGKSITEILDNYSHDSYPVECKKGPLIWLYNQITTDYYQYNRGDIQQEASNIRDTAQLSLLNALMLFVDYFDKYPGEDALKKIINLEWPIEKLHVKALLEEMLSAFDSTCDYLRLPKNEATLSIMQALLKTVEINFEHA